MAIVGVDPDKWEDHNLVHVDSDAPDHRQAILEIERWAAEHNFARVNEYWLRPIARGDRRIFRGVCYRLTAEEMQSAARISQETDQTLTELQHAFTQAGS
jgi:hypothetical protein